MKIFYIRRWRHWQIYFAGFFIVAAVAGSMAQFYGIDSSKPKPIFEGDASQSKIAFACNVFWGEEFIPGMLEIFRNENIKITFFIGGSWAKKYPDILCSLANGGHELGNHSYSHPHPNALNKDENKEQILRTEQLVNELTGTKTVLYAPPYGEYNDTVLRAADELGYKTIMWTIDTIDWKRPPADVITNRVVKKLHNGAIILMHPTEPTVKALPELINSIKNQGYTITTVSDILQ